jgi:Rrf2 family protein
MMYFSKSFGYALRSVLFIAAQEDSSVKVSLDKVAEGLNVPRHFLGKVMKRLVKDGILSSQKGPHGGFYINEQTLATPLISFIHVTGEDEHFKSCVLRLRKCNADRPCPLHSRVLEMRGQWQEIFAATSVNDLLRKDQPGFIESISIL